ncbi:hypothetical protein L873DRAFT_1802411 [Choiromyces venosus 120613-1]|uniref:Uncharacterized protein n=1 Tax=Choiromyces venosus 120613-1 TaxID=1336337 RepID=A0A3N4JZT9_9PEZI|nr:hypothetical protein L873DRAFT_1802411 [Choiromyces venosus 120613-1]
MAIDTIPRGAYLLRLWDTELVATSVPTHPPETIHKDVKTEIHNQATSRERQIWWIERVPGDEENDDFCDKQKYTITHCGLERGLVKNGQKASVNRLHGRPEEHWNFISEFPQFPLHRTYSITADSSSSRLTVPTSSAGVGVTLEEARSPRPLQIWELIPPTPSIPTGWIRIRNAATEATLAHKFTHFPPYLVPENALDTYCCDGNCDKATQWAFVHSSLQVQPRYGGSGTDNRYLMKNRLTGGFLADRGGEEGLTQVCCWSKISTEWIEASFANNCTWEVQSMAPPHIWEFRNRATRRVLVEVITHDQNKNKNQYVSCLDRSEQNPPSSSRWRVDPLDGHLPSEMPQPTPNEEKKPAKPE